MKEALDRWCRGVGWLRLAERRAGLRSFSYEIAAARKQATETEDKASSGYTYQVSSYVSSYVSKHLWTDGRECCLTQ